MPRKSFRETMAEIRERMAEKNRTVTIAEAEAIRAAKGLPPVPSDKQPAPTILVRTYKDADAYNADAPSMAEMGYHPQGQSSSRGQVRMGRTLGKAVTFLPWAIMRPSRKGDPITVTWVKEEAP
jgi:hypothetical protein